jgi:hypothetical protein
MHNDRNVLIISDDENSKTVKLILRHKLVPIIRRSILSAVYFLRHYDIMAIIIDKKNQNVDAIEFILNAREVACDIPIFVPEQYYELEDWSLIISFGKIKIYDEKKYPLNKEIKNLLNQIAKAI